MAKDPVEKLNFIKVESKKDTQHGHLSNHKLDQIQGIDDRNNSQISDFFSQVKLPNFMNKSSHTNENNEDLLSLTGSKDDFNPNSIGSIFSKERQEATGINRVFKKSIIFLGIQLVSFLSVILISLNFFSNFGLNLILLVTSVAITNIFFIIVADRSYVWLSLVSQFLLIIVANSFLGLAFNPITIVLALLVILFNYLAYSELEKIQLSSRLFSISHITGESTRILLTSSIILLSLGVFNSIIFEGIKDGKDQGSRPFLDRVVLSNKLVIDNIFIGRTRSLSVNKFLMGGNLYKETDGTRIVYDEASKSGTVTKQATFGYFLEENYEFNKVITTKEEADFRQLNCNDVGIEAKACGERVQIEINKKLQDWKDKRYSELNFTLDTPLTITNYRTVIKQFYLNRIADFESDKTDNNSFIDSSLLLIPLTNVIPAIFAVLILLLGFIFRFLLGWISLLVNLIIWKILVWTGFAQIDIETVEAEIVSI